MLAFQVLCLALLFIPSYAYKWEWKQETAQPNGPWGTPLPPAVQPTAQDQAGYTTDDNDDIWIFNGWNFTFIMELWKFHSKREKWIPYNVPNQAQVMSGRYRTGLTTQGSNLWVLGGGLHMGWPNYGLGNMSRAARNPGTIFCCVNIALELRTSLYNSSFIQ